jgi:hypothetical protein
MALGCTFFVGVEENWVGVTSQANIVAVLFCSYFARKWRIDGTII